MSPVMLNNWTEHEYINNLPIIIAITIYVNGHTCPYASYLSSIHLDNSNTR